MITDKDQTVLGFNINLNSDLGFEEEEDFGCSSRDQHMTYEEEPSEELRGEDRNIYQELAEKDHYLLLAAEAGKVLLEKNQELSEQYSRLQEEYLHKIESLEQERHHLKRELQDKDYNYESRMQDLHQELNHLSGQLSSVQKASKHQEKSNKSTLQDLNLQNSSLIQELSEVKSYNHDLALQVQTLSKRIDGRLSNINGGGTASKRNSGIFPDYETQDDRHCNGDDVTELDFEEMKHLRNKVQRLKEEKVFLEESLSEIEHEKDIVYTEHQTTVNKMSVLENEVLTLKQQIGICQEDLNKTKKKNTKLKDQLEEYALHQSYNRTPPSNNSLFNELEMSMSEADMNFHNSTPLKRRMSDVDLDGDELPDIYVTTPNNKELNKITFELREVFTKLTSLKRKLTDEEEKVERNSRMEDYETITADMISRLVDQIILLIQERILSLGIIDPRSESPRLGSENGDDLYSLTDSRLSDAEIEQLEQQIMELNKHLNEKTAECENKKKELQSAQASVMEREEELDNLKVKTNKQEREIESLRSERDLILADTSLEDKLKQALEERDQAMKRANDLEAREEQNFCDMKKLNKQLIAAVQQKLELSEQLEAWQFDMASLIDQQLTSQIKNDQKRSRKRSNSTQQQRVKSYVSRFFSKINSNTISSETTPSGTPTIKSPVPPK